MSEAKAPSNLEKFLGAEALPLDVAVFLHDFQAYWKLRDKEGLEHDDAITQLKVDGFKFASDVKDFLTTARSKEPSLLAFKGFNPVMQLVAAGADYEDAVLKYAALNKEFNFSDFVGFCADLVDIVGCVTVIVPGLQEFSVPIKVAAWILSAASLTTASWGGTKEIGTSGEATKDQQTPSTGSTTVTSNGATDTATNSAGAAVTYADNTSGIFNSDTWTNPQGVQGSDAMNSDASMSSKETFGGGAYATETTDRMGNILIDYYNANGTLVSDSWEYVDGSSGSETPYSVGLTNDFTTASKYSAPVVGFEMFTNPDGSYDTTTTDVNDQIVTRHYGVDGTLQSTTTTQGPGTDNNGDPTTTSTTGNVTSTTDSVTGTVVSDSWTAGNGSPVNGTDRYNASGAQSGDAHFADGSSASYTIYYPGAHLSNLSSIITNSSANGTLALGDIANSSMDATINHYDSSGQLTSSTFQLSDGSHGNYNFSNGSGSGVVVHANGWISNFSFDGAGNISVDNLNADGVKISTDWWKSDGTHGSNLYDNGSITSIYTFMPNGQLQVSDGSGGNAELFNAGAVLNPDGNFWAKVANQDGSYCVNFTDDSGDTEIFKFSGTTIASTDQSAISTNPPEQNFHTSFNGNAATSTYNTESAQVTDSDGTKRTVYFNSSGSEVADDWVGTDGSYGDDVFSADDGSSEGRHVNADGSYYDYQADGAGTKQAQFYDAAGNELQEQWYEADGSHGVEDYNSDGSWDSYDYAADGSYNVYVEDATGNYSYTYFNVNGVKTSDQWVNADGKYGDDTFNADGSTSGEAVDAQGNLIDTYADDGAGNKTVYYYDGSGSNSTDVVQDTWTHSDGSSGSDVLGSLAAKQGYSEISNTTNADGSTSRYTRSLSGDTSTSNYSASGALVNSFWSKLDGTSGSTNYSSDGSYSETTNDSKGDVVTALYSGAGIAQSDVWSKSNGTTGTDTLNADGSRSGTTANPDGTHTTFVTTATGVTTSEDYDAEGNFVSSSLTVTTATGTTTTTYAGFNCSGTKLGDSWSKIDGTVGTDVFNPDGSSTGTVTKADGAGSSYTDDGGGTVTTIFHDASQSVTGKTIASTDAQGNITTDTFDATGNLLSVSVLSKDASGNASNQTFTIPANVAQLEQQWLAQTIEGLGGLGTRRTGVLTYGAAQAYYTVYSTTVAYQSDDGKVSGSYSTTSNAWDLNTTIQLEDSTVTVTSQSIATGSAQVTATDTYDNSNLQGWVPVTWTGQPYSSDSNQFIERGLITSTGGFSFDSGVKWATAIETETSQTNLEWGVAVTVNGHVQILSSAPDGVGYNTPFPSAAPANLWTQVASLHADLYTLTSGNQYFDGNQSWRQNVVNAPIGDDTIVGAGVVYLGTGNNTVNDAAIAIAGSGNNTIENADTVYGGSGNDSVDWVSNYYGGTGNAYVTEAYWVAYAGSGNDTISGLGASIYGGSGDDLLVDDGGTITAGTGNDTMLGQGAGWAYFELDPTTIKNDLIGDVTTWQLSANRLDHVEFGQGLSESELHYSWGHTTTSMTGVPGDPLSTYATLDLNWGTSQSVRIIVPGSADTVTSAIGEVDFADGSAISMSDLLALAAAQSDQTMNLRANDGSVSIDPSTITALAADGSISESALTATQSGNDLVLSDSATGSQWRLVNWYGSASTPQLSLTFTDGTVWNASALSALGQGTTAINEVTGSDSPVGAGYTDSWDNTTLAGGVTESKVTYTYADGSTYSTDTITQTDGSYSQTWTKSDGSKGTNTLNIVTGEVTGSNATTGTGYTEIWDNTTQAGGASESKVTYTYADGSSYSTDTVTQADGSYSQSWSKSDGSSGTNTLNKATDEVTGSNATAGAGYTESWDNTVLTNGSSESKVTYTYADGSIYSTDTVTQADGSYAQSWTKSDGSTGTNTLNKGTGEVAGSNATVGAGYAESWDNTTLAGGATESKVTYTYTNGSTYSTDTVTQADGSYSQTWTKSDGSTGTNTLSKATGEVTGANATTGSGYTETWDNTTLASGATESKVAYTYADGSTYSTDTITQADGSYSQSWAKSDGSTGTNTLSKSTGEVTGSNATTGVGYAESWDNTTLASGASESKVTYTYTDGSSYSTDTVTQSDGSYSQSWSKSDGSTGTNALNKAAGEVTGSNATTGTGYTETWDNTTLAGGASESKVTYAYADGSSYSTDTVTQTDGSYSQNWSKSDGSSGTNTLNKATGEVTGSNATAGAGYTQSWDNTTLAGGASESKVTYTYADTSTYSIDTVTQADGASSQSWSKSDGTSGISDVGASAGSGDTFTWAPSQGSGTIQSSDGLDKLALGTGIAADQLWFRQDGSNLDVSVLGSSQQIVVEDWYSGAAQQLQSITLADGTSILGTDVQKLVEAMASFAPPDASQTQYTAQEAQTLQPVIAANWH